MDSRKRLLIVLLGVWWALCAAVFAFGAWIKADAFATEGQYAYTNHAYENAEGLQLGALFCAIVIPGLLFIFKLLAAWIDAGKSKR